MQLVVGVSLLFDISRNRVFAAMLTYGACKIPIRPELASPKLLLDLRATLEDLSGSETLDRGYYFGHRISRNGLHEEMYVILVCPNLQEFHLVPILYLYAYSFHHRIHVFIKYRPSVLCREDQVVYQHRDIVALVHILAHIGTLRRKRRGIQPGEIESAGYNRRLTKSTIQPLLQPALFLQILHP